MPKKPKSMVQLTISLESEDVARLDAYREAHAVGSAPLSRTQVIQAAVKRGLDALEGKRSKKPS